MQATGIIRRIDDLGRIVIPKEIRRSMQIREGDPLELYTTREGEVVLKKYAPMVEGNNENENTQVIDKPTPKTITLYVDICNGKAYKTIEELFPIMRENGEITSFEDWLCNNYTASSLYDEFDCGDFDEVKKDLYKQYEDSLYSEAEDLLNNPRINDYIVIEVEI